MVIAAGTLRNIREANEYSEQVTKLKQIIKEDKLDLSERAKSLEYKLRISGTLSQYLV